MTAVRALFEQTLQFFEPTPVVQALFKRIIQGDDRGEDFEEAIQVDKFFTRRILEMANEALRIGSAKSLAHAVVLLGKDPVRDYILGHSILRKANPNADKIKVGFDEAHSFLQYSRIAESQGRYIGYEQVGTALASGYLFDLYSARLETAEAKEAFRTNWKRALKRAQVSHVLAKHYGSGKVITKKAFPAGLFVELIHLFESEASSNRQIERVTSAEAASLILSLNGFLQSWETVPAFYPDHKLLKFRDFETFELISIVKAADHLVSEEKNSIENAARLLKKSPSDLEDLLATLRKNFEF